MDWSTSQQIALAIEDRPRIELSGTIDVFLARQLLDAATGAVSAEGDVVVDCARLDRLDTSALQVLLALERQLAGQGRRILLRGVGEPVRALFGFAGVEHLLVAQNSEFETPHE
jgi:anti-anti-sigma factor